MRLNDPPTPDERRRASVRIASIRASGRRRRHRRRAIAGAGTVAVAALITAGFVAVAQTGDHRTSVNVIAPGPRVTTLPAPGSTTPGPGHSSAPPAGHRQPYDYCSGSTPETTLPSSVGSPTRSSVETTTQLGYSVVRQSGLLYTPTRLIAGGTTTTYVAGEATGCSQRYMSGYLGLDRSTDNGRHLTRVPLPLDVDEIDSIGFADPTFGYAIGETSHYLSAGNISIAATVAWVTDDGADSWTPVRLPADTGVVTMSATPEAVYIVTDHCNRAWSCTCPPAGCHLVRVPTGATAGTTTALPAAVSAGEANSSDIASAADGANVWIFDSVTHTAAISTDAGRRFATVPLGRQLTGCTYQASALSVLWATCNQEYRSDDGGHSFLQVTATPDAAQWDPVDATTIYRVLRPDIDTAVVQRSVDQGRSFTDVGAPRQNFICYPTFSTVEIGVGLCYDDEGMTTVTGVISTADGGQSWSKDPSP